MPSQKRTLLETLDRKTLIELSKSVGFTGMQILNKADIISKLARKRSVGLEDLLGQLDMRTLKHIRAKLGLSHGGLSKQDQINKILGKGRRVSKPRKKKTPKSPPKKVKKSITKPIPKASSEPKPTMKSKPKPDTNRKITKDHEIQRYGVLPRRNFDDEDNFGAIELMAYKTRVISGEFKLNDHAEVAWVEAKDLSRYEFAPADLPFVEMIRRGEIEL